MTQLQTFGDGIDPADFAATVEFAAPANGSVEEIPPVEAPLVYVDHTGEYHIPVADLQRYLRFTPEQLQAVGVMRAGGVLESVIEQAFPTPKLAPPSPAEVAPAPGSPVPPPGEPGLPPKRFSRPGPCAARGGHPHLPSRYRLVDSEHVMGICQCGAEFPVPCPHRNTRGPGLGQRGDVVCTWCNKVIIGGSGFVDNRNPGWSGRSRAGAADPKAGVRVLSPGDQPSPIAYRGTAVNV